MDADVLPYHWDDRAKLFSDSQYLLGFHERLLEGLAAQLNQIHGVDHGVRYWRILIGPWLSLFVPALFDRYCSVCRALELYELSSTIELRAASGTMVPNDMSDFIRFHTVDEWNHQLIAAVIKWEGNLPVTRCEWSGAHRSEPSRVPGWKQRLRERLISEYSRYASVFTRDSDAFLHTTYLPRRDELRMYRRLGQVPQMWRSVAPVQVELDSSYRDWNINGLSNSEFESLVGFLLPRHLPAVYLEGYSQLIGQIGELPWPKRPSLIWTSGAMHSDDVFKSWTAEKVEQGTPLVIGQHGGHYGTGLWSLLETHETTISDCFMSWGWSEPGEPKVRPIGQLKMAYPLGVQHRKQKGALLVTCALPRVTSWVHSVFISRQYLDYFEDQCVFVSALPEAIRQQLMVRLFHRDYGWDQRNRWQDRFPELALDEGLTSVNDLVRRSRLYITTYNATTFLESFTMDVPTIIFWNPNHWELRESAALFFEDLKRVGIFHETPESAARQVAAIWDDVDSWWNSPLVQEVLESFKERYCHLPGDLLDRIEHTLRDVMASSNDVDGEKSNRS